MDAKITNRKPKAPENQAPPAQAPGAVAKYSDLLVVMLHCTSKNGKPSRAAVREAAHAVVAYHYGWPIRSAVAHDEDNGSVAYRETKDWWVERTPPHERLQVNVAGLVGEVAYHDRNHSPFSCTYRAENVEALVWPDMFHAVHDARALVIMAMAAAGTIPDGPISVEDEAIAQQLEIAEDCAVDILYHRRSGFRKLAKVIYERTPHVVTGAEIEALLARGRAASRRPRPTT